jgi:hypothetical protein
MGLSQEPRQIMRIYPGSEAFGEGAFDKRIFKHVMNSAKLRCYVLREGLPPDCVIARVQYERLSGSYEDVAPAIVPVSWSWTPKRVFEEMTTVLRKDPPVQPQHIRSVELSGLKGSVRLLRDDVINELSAFFPRILLQDGRQDTELMFTVVERT